MSVRVGRSGVLVVDKGAGATSFDVVALVRRRLRVRRVGHAGTLDPGATGVLPVLIGEATKLTPYLMDQDKEYVATVRFGLTTDTLDVSGRVLSETAVFRLERYLLEEACRPFVGRIKQVPPMYSAVHHAGRRLYELAREGIEVDREPREVVVRSIVVDEVAPPRATLRVVCGKGTDVRVLAADLGAAPRSHVARGWRAGRDRRRVACAPPGPAHGRALRPPPRAAGPHMHVRSAPARRAAGRGRSGPQPRPQGPARADRGGRARHRR